MDQSTGDNSLEGNGKEKENHDILSKDLANNLITSKPNNKVGLFNVRALTFLLLWYFFSGCTLFLNKYILTYLNGNPTVLGLFKVYFFCIHWGWRVFFWLGAAQMLMTALCGFIQLYIPCGMNKTVHRLNKPPGFYRHMILVGTFRFTTVVLGLVSLNYVAVSFTETIKSSAPLFTVLISRLLLG